MIGAWCQGLSAARYRNALEIASRISWPNGRYPSNFNKSVRF